MSVSMPAWWTAQQLFLITHDRLIPGYNEPCICSVWLLTIWWPTLQDGTCQDLNNHTKLDWIVTELNCFQHFWTIKRRLHPFGKDEVTSSNLVSSSTKTTQILGFGWFLLWIYNFLRRFEILERPRCLKNRLFANESAKSEDIGTAKTVALQWFPGFYRLQKMGKCRS